MRTLVAVAGAQILAGGQGGGLDVGVIGGSLNALHGDAIALGRHRADAAHAHVGDRVEVMLGDGTRTHAIVVATYRRDLAFGDALLAPELAGGHQTTPLLGTVLIEADHPAAVARRLQTLAPRYPGLRVSGQASFATAADADQEMNRWFGPQFVAEIFAFTSIAVVNTLLMIALWGTRGDARTPVASSIHGSAAGRRRGQLGGGSVRVRVRQLTAAPARNSVRAAAVFDRSGPPALTIFSLWPQTAGPFRPNLQVGTRSRRSTGSARRRGFMRRRSIP